MVHQAASRTKIAMADKPLMDIVQALTMAIAGIIADQSALKDDKHMKNRNSHDTGCACGTFHQTKPREVDK